ncbi:hypothetical protein [Shimia sp.]|uniref:hypothetical protein n=1 Tax=Shimia sp. TaxID=1954381 RepID=UPI003B8E91C5
MTSIAKHSLHSSVREEYLEYIFLAQLCSYAWQTDQFVEVARSHTDAFGYDLVLNCNGVTRHTQLKASVAEGSRTDQSVNVALAGKESGCIVWMIVDPDTLIPQFFLWFGGKAGTPLPDLGDKLAKHTKGNAEGQKAERKNIRKLGKSKFEKLNSVGEVFSRLFEKGD